LWKVSQTRRLEQRRDLGIELVHGLFARQLLAVDVERRGALEPEVVEGLKIRLEQGLAKFAASQVIDGFKKLPAKPVELNDRFQPPVATTNSAKEAPVKVEDGRYAVEEDGTLKFFRVTNGRKPGYVFLNVQASDEWYPVRNVTRIREVLAIIAKDPKAAMVRYGHELGECGKCGRTLTDEASRAAGIGPICAAK
jgi:hypothetical protein